MNFPDYFIAMILLILLSVYAYFAYVSAIGIILTVKIKGMCLTEHQKIQF